MFNVLIGLLRMYGIDKIFAKSQRMTFQPRSLQLVMSEEAVVWRCTGLGVSYHEQLRRRITCLERGVELTSGSMTAHWKKMHRAEPMIDQNRLPASQTEHLPQVYDIIFS